MVGERAQEPWKKQQAETLQVLHSYDFKSVLEQSPTFYQRKDHSGNALYIYIESVTKPTLKFQLEHGLAYSIQVSGIYADGREFSEELVIKVSELTRDYEGYPRSADALGEQCQFLQEAVGVKRIGQRILPPYHFSVYEMRDLRYAVEVMPYCPKPDLSRRIKENGINSWAEMEDAIRCICEVIKYIHRNHRIHGDLKLDGILEYQGHFVAADIIGTMFDLNYTYDDYDPVERNNNSEMVNDAITASNARTLRYTDDRFFALNNNMIKDFGYDHYAVAVCIYQLFNHFAFPYEDPRQPMLSDMTRVKVLFQNVYFPIVAAWPDPDDFVDQPQVATELFRMRGFLSSLDHILQRAFYRPDPKTESDSASFDGYDNRLIERFYNEIIQLIESVKSDDDKKCNLDTMIKISNLTTAERTRERVIQLFGSGTGDLLPLPLEEKPVQSMKEIKSPPQPKNRLAERLRKIIEILRGKK